MSIIKCAFIVVLVLFFGYTIIWNIERFYHWIKCFNIKECSNRKCKFNSFCNKYKDILTEEEVEQLLKLIEQIPD